LCGDHPIIQAIVVGAILIAFGVAIGLMVGLRTTAISTGSGIPAVPSSTALPVTGVKQFLRVGGGDVARQALAVHQEGSGSLDLSGMTLAQRKSAFLAHVPAIGIKGAFPYYPEHGQLVDAQHDFTSYHARGGSRFEEWKHGDSPYTYEKGESDDLARSRRYHVKKAMQFAWAGYEKYAFGMDEIKPASMRGENGWGGFGTTLVDSLDTLWLMDMKDEFRRARDWVRDSLDNNRFRMVSFFETTIRSLGGLLSGTCATTSSQNGNGASAFFFGRDDVVLTPFFHFFPFQHMTGPVTKSFWKKPLISGLACFRRLPTTPWELPTVRSIWPQEIPIIFHGRGTMPLLQNLAPLKSNIEC
jgi:hypothetical protein